MSLIPGGFGAIRTTATSRGTDSTATSTAHSAVSDLNASMYEALIHPVLGAVIPSEFAKVTRSFHPLRVQRWAISDLNPWLAPLKGLAGENPFLYLC